MSRKSNQKYSDDGQMKWCIGNEENGYCGHWEDPKNFYGNRNQCKKHFNEHSNNYHNDWDWNNRANALMSSQENRSPDGLTWEDDLTGDQLKEKFEYYDGRCQACGRKINSQHELVLGHKVSVVNHGRCTISNLEILCDNPKHNPAGKAGTQNQSHFVLRIFGWGKGGATND